MLVFFFFYEMIKSNFAFKIRTSGNSGFDKLTRTAGSRDFPHLSGAAFFCPRGSAGKKYEKAAKAAVKAQIRLTADWLAAD